MEPDASPEVPADPVDAYVPTDAALDAWIAELRTDDAARSRSAVGAHEGHRGRRRHRRRGAVGPAASAAPRCCSPPPPGAATAARC